MRDVNLGLAEAIGRITVDPAILALYAHDRDKAVSELGLVLSAEDLGYLDKYVEALTSQESWSQEIFFTRLRPAIRTIQD